MGIKELMDKMAEGTNSVTGRAGRGTSLDWRRPEDANTTHMKPMSLGTWAALELPNNLKDLLPTRGANQEPTTVQTPTAEMSVEATDDPFSGPNDRVTLPYGSDLVTAHSDIAVAHSPFIMPHQANA
jgi:hypothetical protein